MPPKAKKTTEGFFPILDFTEIDLTRVRLEKYEDDELFYIDAKLFMNQEKGSTEKNNMVIRASSNLPEEPHLTNASSQIHYLADQINRVIEQKILFNNLLKKFNEQVEKNTELMKILDKSNPEKLQEMQEEFQKLKTETEIAKTISEKRKKPSQKNDIGRKHFHFIHQSYLGFTESNSIDKFKYVSTSSEDWKLMNLTATKKDKKILKYQKSNLSKEGNEMKNEFVRAIENYLVKAIFEEYKICIKVSPTLLYKSTNAPFIRFKCQCLVCLRLKTTAEPKSTITVYYYKNATPYFQLQWTQEFPCMHLNPFDLNKENKFLNLFNVEDKYLQKDSKDFTEIYNKVKNKQKIPIIPADKMDPDVISSFIVSKVKEITSSKTEKRDSKKPCTSSAVETKIEIDENDDDDENSEDESGSEDSQKEDSPLGKKSKITKLKNKKPVSPVSKLETDEDSDGSRGTYVADENESTLDE